MPKMPKMPKKRPSDALLLELRAYGLAYPEAHTKSPWPGHLDLAVRDKTFAYLSLEGQPLHISCKLPHSNAAALTLPFVEPAGYGLGKSGWVAATFPDNQLPPIDMLKDWIDESYRAQAPKKLVAQIAGMAAPAARAKSPTRAAPKKKAAPKRKVTKRARAAR